MIEEIKLPEISEDVETGDVVKVLVSVGDTVEVDQPLIELETEKAVFEVPSTAAGKVDEILVSDGDTVKVGSVLVKISADGDAKKSGDEDAEDGSNGEKKKKKKKKKMKSNEGEKGDESKDEENSERDTGSKRRAKTDTPKSSGATSSQPRTDVDRVAVDPAPASPTVRRLARGLGIDIHRVPGSGPGGRITSDDVHKFAKSIITGASQAAVSGAPAGQLPDFSKWGDVERVAMSKIRQVTARNMSTAWNTVPHVTHHDEADITELEAARKRHGDRAKAAGGKLTMTAILLKVCASALKVFPDVNASVDTANEEIVYKKYVNLGVAVDTDRGLLVPVIRDADEKNIVELSVELTDLAEKARTKKISPDQLEGGNFTLSNLGGIGGIAFTPIVYHPEVAILGVSRGAMRPTWREGGFEPRLILPLSLSYDHRLIDGAQAARFLRWVAEALEDPILLALEG